MNHDLKHEKVPGHGDYERRDIGVAGILYFLLGLLVAGGIAHFIVQGVYHYLDNHYETRQPSVSPLVKNIPSDTLSTPPQYNGDYQKYLQDLFPATHWELNDRTRLTVVRKREEDTLSCYYWV